MKRYRVQLSEPAITHLKAIAEYIVERSGLQRTAVSYISEIEARCMRLADAPMSAAVATI